MSTLSQRAVNTTPYSAMAEFKRRVTFPSKLGELVSIQEKVAEEYGLDPVIRRGHIDPSVYTIGFKGEEQNSEVTFAFRIKE